MDSQRLDKWLWYARFFKSRSLATKFCASGKLRVNETVIKKAHFGLHVGDVLTFPKGPHIRVAREPPQPRKISDPRPIKAAVREPGSGRPTKRERRETDYLKGR